MARTARTKTTDADASQIADAAPTASADAPAPARSPRPASKLAQVLAQLETSEGTTIAAMMATTGWQSHTVRGALAGSITRKLGRTVTSAKVEGRGRVYRVEPLAI